MTLGPQTFQKMPGDILGPCPPKRLLYNFIQLFSYKSCIPDCAYTTLYTVFFDKMNFQWLLKEPIIYWILFYRIVYCTQSFFSQILITYWSFWCILTVHYSLKFLFLSLLMSIVIVIDRMCMKVCISSYNIYNVTWIHNR